MDVISLFTDVVLVVFVLGAIMCLYLMMRNSRVLRYRMDLIRQISEVNYQDIDFMARRQMLNRELLDMRWQTFSAVPYNRMVYSFRRFDSFYPDKSFLEPLTEEASNE